MKRTLQMCGYMLLSLSIFLFSCSDDAKLKKNQKDYNLFLLSFIVYRSQGNCLRAEKQNGKGTIYCDRRERGVCNASDLIYTSGQQTARLSDINQIKKEALVDCDLAIASSGILGENVLTQSRQDILKQNNAYYSIDSCESSGILEAGKLFSYSDLSFINSNRGKVAVAADRISIGTFDQAAKASALNCVNTLIKDKLTGKYNEGLRNAISDNRSNARVKNISCSFTIASSTGDTCPANLNGYK